VSRTPGPSTPAKDVSALPGLNHSQKLRGITPLVVVIYNRAEIGMMDLNHNGAKPMNRTNRKLTPEQQARVDRSRKAAEGEDREDLIQQARKAQSQALEESPEQVMAVLKAAREAAGISLREFEVSTGISRGNLSRLENGIANPTIATLRRYAKALGKTVRITVE